MKKKSNDETFHVFLIHNLSQQVLLSSQIAVFIDQLEINRDCLFFISLHVGTYSDEEVVTEIRDFLTSVKTAYL